MPKLAFDLLSPKTAITIFLLVVTGLGLIYFSYDKFFPKQPLKEVGPSSLKALEIKADDLSVLSNALKHNLDYLLRQREMGNGYTLRLGSMTVDTSLLIRSTQRLLTIIEKHEGQVNPQSLASRFRIVQIDIPILVTGYYLPEFKASRTMGTRFKYPIYKVPKDLITVRLGDFIDQPDVGNRVLRGRIAGRFLIPYFTRSEIKNAKGLNPIAYLEDPLDVLLLHIQGSGILTYPDGEVSYVHYAADNGYPYKSIGKILVENGLISRQQADWDGIRQYLRSHPEESKGLLDKNPRFIFFKEEERVEQAIGAQGVPLTPLHSIAVDPEHLPFGGIYVLEVDIPILGHMKTIVVAQDRGGAIKGVNHIDLYIGRGDRAGEIAGRLKSKGKLMILLPRS